MSSKDWFADQVTRHGATGPSAPAAATHSFTRTTSDHQVFDVYIPEALWELDALNAFIARILTLAPGATIYRGASGVWRSQNEDLRVLRISIETTNSSGNEIFNVPNLRVAFRDEATSLLVDLQSRHAHMEQAIFFNDWTTCGTLVTR